MKGKADAAKGWAKGKVAGVRDRIAGRGLVAAVRDANKMLRAPGANPAGVRAGLASLKQRHGLVDASLIAGSTAGTFHVHVQREEDNSADVALDQPADPNAASLFETIAAATMEDFLNHFANWRSPQARPSDGPDPSAAGPTNGTRSRLEQAGGREVRQQEPGDRRAADGRTRVHQPTDRCRSEVTRGSIGLSIPASGSISASGHLRRPRGFRSRCRAPDRGGPKRRNLSTYSHQP